MLGMGVHACCCGTQEAKVEGRIENCIERPSLKKKGRKEGGDGRGEVRKGRISKMIKSEKRSKEENMTGGITSRHLKSIITHADPRSSQRLELSVLSTPGGTRRPSWVSLDINFDRSLILPQQILQRSAYLQIAV